MSNNNNLPFLQLCDILYIINSQRTVDNLRTFTNEVIISEKS